MYPRVFKGMYLDTIVLVLWGMAETLESTYTVTMHRETKDLLYAVAGLLSIVSTYHDIIEDSFEKERSRMAIRALVDKWLELVSPIQYVNGLTTEVSRIVRRKLWEVIPDLTEDLLEKILVETPVFKSRALANDDPVVLEALADTLAVHTVLLLESLHGTWVNWGNYPIIKEIIWGLNDPADRVYKLVSVVALALVLSTN